MKEVIDGSMRSTECYSNLICDMKNQYFCDYDTTTTIFVAGHRTRIQHLTLTTCRTYISQHRGSRDAGKNASVTDKP